MAEIIIPPHEYALTPIRSSGPGGQHVNKVATGFQLRFDIGASSLSDQQKAMLLQFSDQRINQEGIILIKAVKFKSQSKNREDAIERLHELIAKATRKPKKRKKTKVPKKAKEARLQAKAKRSEVKKMRKKIDP
jgi:ribosome-associated protein